jgi:hypothetical protein
VLIIPSSWGSPTVSNLRSSISSLPQGWEYVVTYKSEPSTFEEPLRVVRKVKVSSYAVKYHDYTTSLWLYIKPGSSIFYWVLIAFIYFQETGLTSYYSRRMPVLFLDIITSFQEKDSCPCRPGRHDSPPRSHGACLDHGWLPASM